MRQNVDLTVRSAAEKGKEEEVARRELQQALESISSRETASKATISNLRNEKVALERRTRELEVNLQQVISAATPKRKGRPRSSSLSDVRVTTLERDLGESRASVLNLQAELGKAQEKLRRNEEDLVRVENERTVLERRMAHETKNMEEILASKDEEILRLSGGEDLGLAQEREEELIRRIEEEEAKVQALERLLSETRDLKAMESALQKAEKRIAAEISKAKGLEEKNAGLGRDMRQARDALEESHAHARSLKTALDDRDSLVHSLRAQERYVGNDLPAKRILILGRALKAQVGVQQEEIRSFRATQSSTSSICSLYRKQLMDFSSAPASSATPGHTHDGPVTDVETIEKLLAAVDRLRGERDDLRRQLEFLQVESKFTIEALENQINSGASSVKAAATEDLRVLQLQNEVQELLERLAKANSRSHMGLSSSAMESSRLGLIASASLVMVEHLQTRADHDSEAMDQALIEISHLRSELQDTMASSGESHRASHTLQQSLLDLQHRLESSTSSLHDTQRQRDDLFLQLEHLQSQIMAINHIGEQYQELQSSHERTTARLAEVTNALEDAESERNSLRVEVVNLQGDMVSAQGSLKQAEQRYSDLQNQQLSSMSSAQVNRKLKEQIEELEGRVARRTEQIGIHQHDIKRLETNLKLQEDRIAEMTNELEIAMSEKESMVEDCADAREARDRALRKADDLEDAVETLGTQRRSFEAQRDTEVSALVEVWSSTLAKSRSSVTRLRAAAHEASAANLDLSQRLQFISAEHDSALSLLKRQASELELDRRAAVAHREEARNAVVALAVVRTTDAEHRRAIQQDRERICALLSATRDELNDRLEEIGSLQDRLQGRRTQELAESTEEQARHSVEVAKLKAANADLSQVRAELEDELAQSRKELLLAAEQHDRLCADTDAIKEQIAQLHTHHAEELESLRGKLQQVAVDLQEAREAHALTEKASLELSAANAELEGRLDSMSKQQDADSLLIADLQSREADHKKQVLGIQNRLDNATEELQQTTREKDDLEILLRQARTGLSRATDATEDRVRELLQERDALQEQMDRAESHHTTELVQVQERLQRLQTEADSLRAQLDKAIADTKRMRAAFETELRESAERCENAGAQQDAAQAQLSSLEIEFDDLETRLETAMEEKDALEAKNTNLESEIQRTLSMQRYLESQLKDRSAKSRLSILLPRSHCCFAAHTSPPSQRQNSNKSERNSRMPNEMGKQLKSGLLSRPHNTIKRWPPSNRRSKVCRQDQGKTKGSKNSKERSGIWMH
jgi:chromosome segregation ATPase